MGVFAHAQEELEDTNVRVLKALWYTNFRDLHILESGVIHIKKREFSGNALRLLLDLADSFKYTLTLSGNRAVLTPKG